ncbi:hypothetical protein RJ641_036237 [Dillenia turbinata]|uniref:Uncharacterized protein n=1 Tax=Dillenia turbinata TaxID=194707 RepID=A0AAN8VSU9_9MAGN
MKFLFLDRARIRTEDLYQKLIPVQSRLEAKAGFGIQSTTEHGKATSGNCTGTTARHGILQSRFAQKDCMEKRTLFKTWLCAEELTSGPSSTDKTMKIYPGMLAPAGRGT